MIIDKYAFYSKKLPDSYAWVVRPELSADFVCFNYDEFVLFREFFDVSDKVYPIIAARSILFKECKAYYKKTRIFSEDVSSSVVVGRYLLYDGVYVVSVAFGGAMGCLFLDKSKKTFLGSYSRELGGISSPRVARIMLVLSQYFDFDNLF